MNHFRLVCLVILILGSTARDKTHRDLSNAAALSGVQRYVRFANRTVYGAMIFTDPATANLLGRDFYRVPQGVNGTALDNANARLAHGKKFIAEFPIPVESVWSVFAQSCPWRTTKGNDRGVAMAHFLIWHDWVFQGRRGVDKTIANDDDIMIVFEDDAVVAVTDVKAVLLQELSGMTTDLHFLGWCYGGGRRMPMCTHAYAVSRRGAKKMVEEWDTCSTSSIDGQWKAMAQHGLFTWSKANLELLKAQGRIAPGFEDSPGFFTRGVFVQKNGFVSFNHHGFQNNANG